MENKHNLSQLNGQNAKDIHLFYIYLNNYIENDLDCYVIVIARPSWFWKSVFHKKK